MSALPVLYSFRRCPYAIRARMALVYSGIPVELREVKLSDMPESMLQLSPKATVPVLALDNGQIIDESLDIMNWSLSRSDPELWRDIDASAKQLIHRCDEEFKPLLDHYKYADRHPLLSQADHRARAEVFLLELEQRLELHDCLHDNRYRLVDIAIMPFVRQFAGVDAEWFEGSKFQRLKKWLSTLIATELFSSIMKKHPFWQPGSDAIRL